jgi:hypothetical protein
MFCGRGRIGAAGAVGHLLSGDVKTVAEAKPARTAQIRPSGRLRFSDGARSGAKGLLRVTGAKVLTTFYRRMLFMSYQLDGAEIPVYNAKVSVDFGQLKPDELDAYRRLRPDCNMAEVAQRLAAGHRCFVCWHEGEIVEACWSATSDIHVGYMRRYLRVPTGDVYSFDSYTDPRFRGQGVYMARNSYQARLNRAEGLKRSIALVAYENYAAWLILSRSGLKTLGTYHYLRLPGSGFYWNTPAPGQMLPLLTERPSAAAVQRGRFFQAREA